MTSTVAVAFYLHTILCAGYLAYLAKAAFDRASRRVAPEGPGAEFSAPDDTIVVVTGQVSLLLYLVYAEAYLYRTLHLLG